MRSSARGPLDPGRRSKFRGAVGSTGATDHPTGQGRRGALPEAEAAVAGNRGQFGGLQVDAPVVMGVVTGAVGAGLCSLNRVGILQRDGAALQQGLEVGDDLRPPTGHRCDEFRGITLDHVSDGEFDRCATGLNLHGA